MDLTPDMSPTLSGRQMGFDGGQHLIEDDLSWKMKFGNNFQWNMTFDVRVPLMEDALLLKKISFR